jgi:hypothetical protein
MGYGIGASLVGEDMVAWPERSWPRRPKEVSNDSADGCECAQVRQRFNTAIAKVTDIQGRVDGIGYWSQETSHLS